MRRGERSEPRCSERAVPARMPSLKRVQNGLLGVVLLVPLAVSADVVPNGPPPSAQKELDQVQQEIGRFEEASKDYKGTVKHVVQQEYVEKRRQVMGKFKSQIDK